MNASIQINNEAVTLRASMRWLLNFKTGMAADPLKGLLETVGGLEPLLRAGLGGNLSTFDLGTLSVDAEFLERAVWAMAYTADPGILDPVSFYTHFENAALDRESLFSVAVLLYETSLVSSAQSAESEEEAASEEEPEEDSISVTLEEIVLYGLRIGLTIADTDVLTLGQWINIINCNNGLVKETMTEAGSVGEAGVRTATQADYDAFTRGG